VGTKLVKLLAFQNGLLVNAAGFERDKAFDVLKILKKAAGLGLRLANAELANE